MDVVDGDVVKEKLGLLIGELLPEHFKDITLEGMLNIGVTFDALKNC